MPAIPVKWFQQSTMGDFPSIEGEVVGQFIAMLKGCLIDGFNDQTPTSATYADGVVTLTFAAAHGFVPYQVIDVTGANEADYNGQFRVVSVDNALFTLTYVPDVAPVPTATGTMTARAAPVGGWEVIWEDAVEHRIVLGRTHPDASDYYFKVHNNDPLDAGAASGSAGQNAWYAYVETVTNYVDENHYDAVHTGYWPASNRYRTGTSIETYFFADDRMFYFAPRYGNSTGRPTVLCWGDINSVIPGDRGHCIICGISAGYSLSYEWDVASDDIRNYWPRNHQTTHKVMMTEYHNLPGTIAWSTCGYNTATWGTLLAWPNASNNGMILSTQPLGVLENGDRGVTLRGFLPGIVEPLNWTTSMDNQITTGHPGMETAPVYWLRVANHIDNQDSGTAPSVWRLDNWREQVG